MSICVFKVTIHRATEDVVAVLQADTALACWTSLEQVIKPVPTDNGNTFPNASLKQGVSSMILNMFLLMHSKHVLYFSTCL